MCGETYKVPEYAYDGVLKEKATEAASALVSAFTWSKTEEGHDFWASVEERLSQIAADGRLTNKDIPKPIEPVHDILARRKEAVL